ncbi:MAG: hypothetical protein ABI807_10945 [Sporichthyaceae bacterium]
MPDRDTPTADAWEPLRSELAADLRRVADRLRSMSQTRLEAQVVPPEHGMPPWGSRAAAARGVATLMSDVASALEAAAAGGGYPGYRPLPELSVHATGDQVAVAGHDLQAALDLVGPDDPAWFGPYDRRPARGGVQPAVRVLADVRRQL